MISAHGNSRLDWPQIRSVIEGLRAFHCDALKHSFSHFLTWPQQLPRLGQCSRWDPTTARHACGRVARYVRSISRSTTFYFLWRFHSISCMMMRMRVKCGDLLWKPNLLDFRAEGYCSWSRVI